jgi:sucrose phosphorylase
LARPRSAPVLTPYYCVRTKNNEYKAYLGKSQPKPKERVIGSGWVWTTFSRAPQKDGSEDTRQVDLNYTNPNVLLKAIDVLLFYVAQGASFIRLDAIAYIWKNIGTSSIHEHQVHDLLAVMDEALNQAAPHVKTIAEINESQKTYLSYLGTDSNPEADSVYQFVPFPLAVHAVLTGQSSYFNNWLSSTNNFHGRQFITVLGTHDGMGLKPIRDILPSEELTQLIQILTDHHKNPPNFCFLPGGEKAIYEICATPWNLINNPNIDEPIQTQINRYRAVLALGLLVRGIPGIYINGLLGAPNYLPPEGLDENRTTNRESFSLEKITANLTNPHSQTSLVYKSVTQLLQQRNNEPAFSSQAGPLKVLETNNSQIIAAHLNAPKRQDDIIAIINISNDSQKASFNIQSPPMINILTNQKLSSLKETNLTPYQVIWLKQV